MPRVLVRQDADLALVELAVGRAVDGDEDVLLAAGDGCGTIREGRSAGGRAVDSRLYFLTRKKSTPCSCAPSTLGLMSAVAVGWVACEALGLVGATVIVSGGRRVEWWCKEGRQTGWNPPSGMGHQGALGRPPTHNCLPTTSQTAMHVAHMYLPRLCKLPLLLHACNPIHQSLRRQRG